MCGVGLFFVGVFPLCAESNMRIDWLSFIAMMMTNVVVGAKVFSAWRCLFALLILVVAAHLSSLSLVRM